MVQEKNQDRVSGKQPQLWVQVFIITLILILVSIVFFFGSRTYKEATKVAKGQFNQQQLILARSAATSINYFIGDLELEDDLILLSRLPVVQKIDPGCLKHLESIYLRFLPKTSIWRIDQNSILCVLFPSNRSILYVLGLVVLVLAAGGFSLFIISYRWSKYLKREVTRQTRELRETGDYLQSLIQNANAPIIVWNGNKQITIFNKEFEKISGRTESEMKEKSLDVLFPEDSRSDIIKKIEGTLRGESWKNLEMPIIRKNGEKRIVLWNSANIYSEDGTKLIATIAQGQDITMRKKAEEMLQESERKFRTIIESSHEMIFSKDLEGRYHTLNLHAAVGLGGTSIEDIEGKTDYDIMPKEWADAIRETDKKVIKNNEKIEVEEVICNALGEERIYFSRKWPLYDNEGNITGINCFALDITERKQAEIALRESEAKYRATFESTGAATVIYGENMIMSLVNTEFTKLSGYSKEEIEGNKSIIDFVNKDELESIEEYHLLRGITDDIIPGSCEIKFIDKQGNVKDIFMTVSMISGTKMSVASLLDITRQKRIENQLVQAQKIDAVGTLTAGFAHELNNLLVPMLGFSELVLSDLPAESKSRRDLNQVLKAAERARKLVAQILSFSWPDEGERKLIYLTDTIDEVLKLLRPTLPATIDINKNIAPDTGQIYADPTQMYQVLMNLCTNAYQAMMPKGGILEISIANIELDKKSCKKFNGLMPGFYIKLTIKDSGCGMDKKILEKIFDPFIVIKNNGMSAGMGLSVVHSIIESHSGYITVKSKPSAGTTFEVYLPVARSIAEVRPEITKPVKGGTESILLIDDEIAVAETEKRMLERLGYKVTMRTSSLEALELYRINSGEFDLVIMDQTMPGLTGAQLAVKFLNIKPDIPIILCTGYSRSITSEKAQGLGVSKLVMKPLVGTELGRIVRQVLDK